MAPILMQSESEYFLKVRGNEMTLRHEGDRWAMYTVNAAVRAWSRGFANPRYFDNLEAVEAHYKAWRGITALVADS